ncbi:unnamed protein product [Brachionus calyciflorus]|uniref:Uncharacterized protein n=1 Tax=Brachionus calyciflorus TaxID=104777 RepID=A0A814LC22_9BILA|nr:unnamed protein product [Brachionus calyciflorus]
MRRGIGNNLVYDGENGTFDEFEAAFNGKAKKLFEQMTETDKTSIKSIIEKLKRGCVKSPEYYLNLIYSRQLKHEEKISTFCYEIEKLIDKGLPLGDL